MHSNFLLRVRWTISTTVADPLCPADCSGQGTCVNPNQYPAGKMQPMYNCQCNTGFGGPYCNGALTSVALTSGFNSGNALAVPGTWSYFYVAVPSSSYLTTVNLQWSFGMGGGVGSAAAAAFGQGSSTMLLVLSTLYGNSMGDLLLNPVTSLIYNTSGTIQARLL